jgi:phosphotransferase system enzyme I (PtsI)
VVDVNADSVGLFRTEFLFMNRQDYPSEEEHFDCYKTIISLLGGKEFTIRTADLGADKLPQKFRSRFSNTMNSALGLRGLRFSLKEPELFIPQLKSIVRASAFGNIRLMLPMVTNTKEIEQVFEHIDLIKNELELDGVAYDKNMPIGAMIEVPSAAIAAPMFVEILDFLSIGSNDLIQYSNAVDRQDSEVSYLYEPLHFGVIKLISLTVAAGIQGNKPVSICGEMASDVRYTSLLLGLGLSELSVRPAVLFEIKERIEGISVRDSKEMVERFLETADSVILESLIAR